MAAVKAAIHEAKALGKRAKSIVHTATDSSSSDPPPKKQKLVKSGAKKILEDTTLEQLQVVSTLLAFKIFFCKPINRAAALCGYSANICPFYVYPVLYREPVAPGTLPISLTNGDLGYILGAADPSHIRTAIIDAYVLTHPGCNVLASPWEDWEIYRFNRTYYGSVNWEKNGHQDVNDLSDEILHSKTFGGTKPRPETLFARNVTQKKANLAVYLDDYYRAKPPAEVPSSVTEPFYDKDALLIFNSRYRTDIEFAKTVKLNKADLAKAVDDFASSVLDE